MNRCMTMARKLAGISAVPAWLEALRRYCVAARHRFADAHIVSFEPPARPAAAWQVVFTSDERAALIEAPALLKPDVQGFELPPWRLISWFDIDALKGCA